jgi:hypothetical protein
LRNKAKPNHGNLKGRSQLKEGTDLHTEKRERREKKQGNREKREEPSSS